MPDSAAVISRAQPPSMAQSYELGLISSESASANVEFAGNWVAPRFTGASRATVVAPFTFEGQFDFPSSSPDTPPSLNLSGSGIARLRLSWSTSRVPTGGWEFESARYQFTGSPKPVPEPGTLVFLASGLAGLAYRGRTGRSKRGAVRTDDRVQSSAERPARQHDAPFIAPVDAPVTVR